MMRRYEPALSESCRSAGAAFRSTDGSLLPAGRPGSVDHGGVHQDELLTIGAFAHRTQLSVKALRLYDRLGLLSPAVVDPHSRYRRYAESQLYTARLIVMLRRLDMPLARIAEVLAVDGSQGAELLTSYWDEIETRIAVQRKQSELLRLGLIEGAGRFGGFAVREREVPAQPVRAEQRFIDVTELDAFIWPTIRRLTPPDGAAGPPFVIYHGPVDADRNGPVEVCVPVLPGLATRCEPAHREAYARVTKGQFGFPQVLSAYDAVQEWVRSYGCPFRWSPREVYLADPHAAGPADAVGDIAFPFELIDPAPGGTSTMAP